LWSDSNAEEAVEFYVSIFKNSRIKKVARYREAGAKASGRATGSVMIISVQLERQDFLALNGGPLFTFSPAISLMVNCKTQKEIDELWKKLSADTDAEQRGWLKDKFGVSSQIVPAIIGKMVADEDAKRANRVMQAVLQMKKLDIKTLEKAYQGG